MNAEQRRNVMEICTILARQKGLKVNLAHSVRNAATVGASSLVGSIVFGPIGLIAGAVVSSVVAATSKNDYKPAWEIIRDLPQHDQEQLIKALQRAMSATTATDFLKWISMALSTTSVQAVIVKELIGFLHAQLGYQVSY